MPTLYGEGSRAFRRLQEEIMQRIPDQSLSLHGEHFIEAPNCFKSCVPVHCLGGGKSHSSLNPRACRPHLRPLSPRPLLPPRTAGESVLLLTLPLTPYPRRPTRIHVVSLRHPYTVPTHTPILIFLSEPNGETRTRPTRGGYEALGMVPSNPRLRARGASQASPRACVLHRTIHL